LIVCVVVGTIGGLLPDIDSNHSKPLTVGFRIFSMLIAFGMVIWFSSRLALLELLLVWAVTYYVMQQGVFKLFTQTTVHRGVIHSVPYTLLFGLITVYFCFYGVGLSAKESWLLGSFICFGALVHLLLDEAYSVDLMGVRIKRSFGTAFKFYQTRHWYWYALLYLTVWVGWYFAPSAHDFVMVFGQPDTWQMLRDRFI
ncbi:MAG: metal-dependent hydrolase, partial [Pseudomonadota bacterium]|nr:metal-dependent hydrolase [Pseudomonadota bacterium]